MLEAETWTEPSVPCILVLFRIAERRMPDLSDGRMLTVKYYPYSVIGRLIWTAGIGGTNLLGEAKLELERAERLGRIGREIEKYRMKSKLVTIKRALDDLEINKKRAIGEEYHELVGEANLHIDIISHGLSAIIERAEAIGLELSV